MGSGGKTSHIQIDTGWKCSAFLSGHWIRGYMGPRVCIYAVMKSLRPCLEFNPICPTRSHSTDLANLLLTYFLHRAESSRNLAFYPCPGLAVSLFLLG